MYNFLPDIYTKSIYTVNYENLINAGIKVVIFDLDNTIAPISIDRPSNKLVLLFDDIKKMGLTPIIVSNRNAKRVEPFKEELFVDAACKAYKPLARKYKKIFKLYNVSACEVAAIGDMMISDVYGANKLGITSILVNPISTNDLKGVRIFRKIDSSIMKHFSKNGVFIKGEYYE